MVCRRSVRDLTASSTGASPGGAPLGIVGNSAGTGTLETGMYDPQEENK